MSRRRWLVLLLLSAVPAAGEAALLRGIGFGSALSLAPQITAISPYGSFHDLRWIAVYHASWPALVAELVAAVVIRTGWAVAMTVAAAPGVTRSDSGARRLALSGTAVRALALRALAFQWDALESGVKGCYYHTRAVYYRIQ